MSSSCKICIIVLLTLAFLVHHCNCEGSFQIPTSSKNAKDQSTERMSSLVQHPTITSFGPTYIRITENGHKTSTTKLVHGYHKKSQETVKAIETAQQMSTSGPCSIQYCSKDTTVNCAGLSLTEVTSTLFPRNSTSILLDNNDLTLINNSSFSHLSELRVLSLSNNSIKHIQQNTFKGLDNLEALNLERNGLGKADFSAGLFDPLVRLTDLRLRYNRLNYNLNGSLFKHLKNLHSLTIDATGETFSLGNEFPNVRRLVLSGDVKSLDRKSFENVQHISQLIVEDLPSLSNFTDTALQPLHFLDVFTISKTYIGTTKSLHTLKPLVGKNMTSIVINRVSFSKSEAYTSIYNNEGILNLEKTKYLITICVRHVSFMDSNIYVIEENAIMSRVWNKCLRSLDLSHNPLKGTKLALSALINFKHIEILIMENANKNCLKKESFPSKGINAMENGIAPVMKEISLCGHDLESINNMINNSGNIDSDEDLADSYSEQVNTHLEKRFIDGSSVNGKQMPLDYKNTVQCSSSNMLSTDDNSSGYFRVYLATSLKYLKMVCLTSSAGVAVNLIFVGTTNLVYWDARNNGFKEFTGIIIGLDALQTFMLSGNDLSMLAVYFFDRMCKLEELYLSNCLLNTDFMSNQSNRVFYNLHNLKRLDLSSNSLYSLKPGTFSSNRMLEKLDLSKNRFRNIPFNLEHTPNLKLLDLRENSLSSVDPNERHELDKLANQPGGFNLLISGNVLSCGCHSLRFLHWLATTRVRIDDEHSFTCINNDGHLSDWRVSDDLEELWRKCSGEVFLSLAVILLFIMTTGFLSVFVIWKNKTFIQSKLLQLLTGYKLKTPEDYQNRVFIGYADKDYAFPCLVLRKFIEEELRLSTYVYHRDMDPTTGVASNIVDAINASWRTVLVFSDNFLLNDEWSIFTLRSAVFALSPDNPSRVVVLVHDNLQHRLPAEVVGAVHEENIIAVSQWTMSYSLREKLKSLL